MLKFVLTNSPVATLNKAKVAQGLITGERTVLGTALNWVRIIGTGMALIMLTYMAIVYIDATPSGKEEVKKRLTNYAIGAIVFIGASNILYYAQEIVTDILKGVGGG